MMLKSISISSRFASGVSSGRRCSNERSYWTLIGSVRRSPAAVRAVLAAEPVPDDSVTAD